MHWKHELSVYSNGSKMGIDDSTIQLFNFYRTYAYTLKSITLLQPLMALVLNVGN